MSANLKFYNYEILKFDFLKITEPSGDGVIQFLYKVFPEDKDMNKVRAVEGVKIEATEESPYYIECIIAGQFEVNPGAQSEEKIKMFESNAAAILFPYLRALISVITAQNPNTRVILPPININAVMKKNEAKNIISDEKYEDFILSLR